MGCKVNISFLAKKLPYSQICGTKVGSSLKNGVFDVDSEDDSTDEFRWIRENMFNQINEFTDVNKDEKLVMQLWNHHVMSRKVLSLNHIYESCKEISLKYSNFILKKNLRRNFLLHLLNLVDHSLLKPSK